MVESTKTMDELRAPVLVALDDGQSEPSFVPTLIREGYRVERCQDIHTFLTDYQRFAPRLVILDGALPDAFTICARLHEQDRVPILMLTANDDSAVERAFAMGATDVLFKPVHTMLLIRRIRVVFETQRLTNHARDSERRWQQSFERNRAVQLIVNPQSGQIVDANPAACAFYGYSRADFRNIFVTDLEVPNDGERDRTTLFNFRHRIASGELRDVKIFSSPFESGGETLLYLIIYDMTKRRRAEAAETDQRMLADALRNTAAVLSGTLDQNEVLDRILEHLNLVVPSDCANIMLIEAGVARAVRWRGYDIETGLEFIQQIRMKVRETKTLNWMIENNRPLVIPDVDQYSEWFLFDDTRPWLKSYVGAPIRIGNYVIGFLNIDSITPKQFTDADGDHLQAFADQAAVAIRNARLYDRVRHQAAEMERRVIQRTAELEYERSQLRAIMDAMTEGVAYTEYFDNEFHTRYVNQALEDMLGYSPVDWHTHSINLFRSSAVSDADFDRQVEAAVEELRTRGFWRGENRLRRKDGSEFDAMVITTRIKESGSDISGAVTVVRDVSKEKALQQQKERFVAHASHELRTPITNLKTRLYLMRRQPERMEEHMRVLEQVTDRMKRLVEDLLDVSRFERGIIHLRFQNVLLQDIVQNLVLVQLPEAERKNLRLECSLPETPICVQADPERLGQVITNLLTNAIIYTPEGGRVDVRLNLDGSRAHVEVEDTGIGIAEEHLPHIFQAFYRVISEVEGTGLGLSITREIVEFHGGEISAESRVGQGSIFRFWLPVIPAPECAEIEGS